MLKYDRTDISEEIDVDKKDRSRECKFCQDIAIVHIKNNACRIYFQHMSKHKAKKKKNEYV